MLPWPRAALLALGATCLLVGLGFKYWQPMGQEEEACAQPVHSHEPPRQGPAGPSAVGGVEAIAAREAPATVAPNHQARVVASLHHVLTVGLTVSTVLDEARLRRRRAAP